MFANSGTEEETKFLPNSLATGKTYFSSKASPLGPFAWQTHPFHQSQTVAMVRGMLMADVAVEFENHNEHPLEN